VFYKKFLKKKVFGGGGGGGVLTYNLVTGKECVPKELRFENGLNFSLKLNPSILITIYKLKSYLVGPLGCHNLWCWAIDIYKELLTV